MQGVGEIWRGVVEIWREVERWGGVGEIWGGVGRIWEELKDREGRERWGGRWNKNQFVKSICAPAFLCKCLCALRPGLLFFFIKGDEVNKTMSW